MRLLQRSMPIRRILFLCIGNVCRSPYAERRLRQWIDDPSVLEVRSAGIMAAGRECPEEARILARQRGLELEDHRSVTLTSELTDGVDLVVVMSADQKGVAVQKMGFPADRVVLLVDLDPESPDRRWIPDPLDEPLEAYRESFDQLDRCLSELLRAVVG